jgi:chemotaxis protein CheX
MPFPVDAYESEMSQIVGDVFQTMLRIDVAPAPQPWTARAGDITAAIFFAGTWMGAAVMECTEQQARKWTGLLLSIPEPPIINDDVRDAMGELVNMIGGNLKSVLPPGVGLSMPSVVEGKQYSLQICGSNLIDRQCFQSDEGSFGITLVEVVGQ